MKDFRLKIASQLISRAAAAKLGAAFVAVSALGLSACTTAEVCQPAALAPGQRGLDQKYFNCVMYRDAVPKVKSCYAAEFGRNMSNDTTVVTDFAIDTSGTVSDVKVTPDMHRPAFQGCMKDAVSSLKFEPPNVPMKIHFPWTIYGGRGSML